MAMMTPFRAAPSVLIAILLAIGLMVAFALGARAAPVLLVLGSGLLVLLWRTQVAVRENLGASAAEVRARIARLGSGDFALDSPVLGYRKESVMGWLEEAQGELIAIEQARRQTEERQQVSEARCRLLAENASDVIWTMSLDGRITYVSPSVERLRGFTPTEASSSRSRRS
ncbi:PAS domain S-box protein [uncultured Thiodictyon sp.]|uniref:PAS domain S-box protein n=1 Tax=uncultured Thiodictyon sp. TaxID=1846217 RepID=UPI0025F38583|nr:PAS domain S-box protein [uncultured Thiodictyon sp.]